MAKKRSPQTKKKIGGPKPPEGGPRPEKAAAVQEISRRLTESTVVLFAEYRGMTVGELAELRAGLRKADGNFKVIKNTLATIAAHQAGLDELEPIFAGTTAAAYGEGDPVALAKQLADFGKRVPALSLKGGVLEGRVLDAEAANALATLESREVMLAKAAGMLITPVQRLANLFAAPLQQLGALFAQLRDKQGSPEEAPAQA